MSFSKGKITPASAVAADMVSIGDSWLNFAISKAVIEPLEGIEDQEWFKGLSNKWKVRIIACLFDENVSSQNQFIFTFALMFLFGG